MDTSLKWQLIKSMFSYHNTAGDLKTFQMSKTTEELTSGFERPGIHCDANPVLSSQTLK